MIAYHFTSDRLRDGRPLPEIGETLVHEGPVEICQSGLHASQCPFDALTYAPGPHLSIVLCGRVEQSHADKFVCRERTVLLRFDATDLLRRFARKCALDVIDKWDAPPVVRQYLEMGDEDLRDAAWDAARAEQRARFRQMVAETIRDYRGAA